MTNRALGCYIRLLCYCWREGSIPADVNEIAKLCGEKPETMASLWIRILPCFKFRRGADDRLVHGRLNIERRKQEAQRRLKSKAGKAGAKGRWGKGLEQEAGNGTGNAGAMAEGMANDGYSSSASSSASASPSKKSTDCQTPWAGALAFMSQLSHEKPYADYAHNPELCQKLPALWPEWEQSYAIDVESEIRKARLWELANPQRRKKGKIRFLTNWLNRAQDGQRVQHGGGVGQMTGRRLLSPEELREKGDIE